MRSWMVLLTLTACTGSDDKGAEPSFELCNGEDDDLDGEVDEDFTDMDADGIADCIEASPNITMDDGCDLVTVMHTKMTKYLKSVFAGTEETSTGVTRLRAMAADKKLKFPVVAINDADTKHLFDNRYGTGQSTLDGVLRATNMLVAGSTVVIAGYGWCGRGLAARAKGMGATVMVTEVDPLRALEAQMDGYISCSMEEAAPKGDLFITVTGNKSVIRKEHFAAMKDGAIVCNSGHFNVELDIPSLERMAVSKRQARAFVDEYKLKGGKRVYLTGRGSQVSRSFVACIRP